MTDTPQIATDERVKEISPLRRALIRPELGGIIGTVAVFTMMTSKIKLFFCLTFR